MSKLFITGDRSLPPYVAALPLAVLVARQLLDPPNLGVQFVTGDLPGAETAARELFRVIGIESEIVPSGGDWLERAQLLKGVMGVDRVIFVHGDPHASRMLPPLLEVFGDAVEIVVPEMVFA